jgi:hypothetical protein
VRAAPHGRGGAAGADLPARAGVHVRPGDPRHEVGKE